MQKPTNMPPKRRRRFQGLYYHSSPPKGECAVNTYSYSKSAILIEGNCGDNTPNRRRWEVSVVFVAKICILRAVEGVSSTSYNATGSCAVDCHIKWQPLMRHFRGTFEQFLLPLIPCVCVCMCVCACVGVWAWEMEWKFNDSPRPTNSHVTAAKVVEQFLKVSDQK